VFSGAPSGLLTDPGPYLKAGMQLPDVIRAQLIARERGAQLAEISFDPEEAARKLLHARRDARTLMAILKLNAKVLTIEQV